MTNEAKLAGHQKSNAAGNDRDVKNFIVSTVTTAEEVTRPDQSQSTSISSECTNARDRENPEVNLASPSTSKVPQMNGSIAD